MTPEEISKLTHRLLDLVEHDTTEVGEGPMTVPVSDYLDPDRWRAEVDSIFRTVPLLLALTGDLPDPGDHKAMTVLGRPILLTRGADGVVRSFLNVCRHRGAVVAEEGCGHARRHSCPYHGWTYDSEGSLVGVPGEKTITGSGGAALDRSALGLTPLPVVERSGLVFGQITPGIELDVDAWSSGLLDLLAPLDISSWRLLDRRELDGPNWKVCYDGYLEGYHFASLHRTTLFSQIKSNVMCFDSYGPHQRIGFARQDITDLRAKPETEWEPFEGISVIVTFFPHCSLVLGPHGGFLSQLWPGDTPGTSRTTQSTYSSILPRTDAERAAIAGRADWLYSVVRDEDYATGFSIQQALASGAAGAATDTFVFGANELGNQRFHRTVASLLS